jgi:hypothetical protein
MKRFLLSILIFFSLVNHAISQAGITVESITLTPKTQAERLAIATPKLGQSVYQKDGIVGIYTYNGTAWVGSSGLTGATGATGLNGVNGTNGTNGANGLSAYQVWVNSGNVGTTTDFLNSLKGATGLTGATGAIGATGLTGATGAIGATGLTGATGEIGATGLTGATGLIGATGANGLSAYQVWVNSGNVGTTTDFLNSLKGATGLTGATGAIGATGLTGATGAIGATGLTGATGAIGATGLTGATGAIGANGKSFFQGTVNPISGLGVDNDSYLNNSSGDFFEKVVGVWTLRTNIYGRGNFGDGKMGFQAIDHNGWVRMDGRLKTTLTATQQAVLLTIPALSSGTTLPVIADKVMVGVSATKLINSSGGLATATLTQANLPAINLIGGSHNHSTGLSSWSSNLSANGGERFFGTSGVNGSSASSVTSNPSGNLTIPLGGSGIAIPVQDPYIAMNGFVYLGN